MSRTIRAVFFTFVLFLPICTFGQVKANTPTRTILITGRFTDARGTGIPQTSVILSSLGTRQKVSETKTNEHGDFAFQEFPSQAYEVYFHAAGFYPDTRRISETGHGAFDSGTVKLVLEEEKPYFEIPNPAAPNTPSTKIQTNVCQLIENSNLFHGKFVEIHANVRSPGIESLATVFDAKCRAGLRLLLPDQTSPNETSEGSIEEIRKLARLLSDGQTAEATMMGKFEIQLVQGGRTELKFRLLSASEVGSAMGTAIRR